MLASRNDTVRAGLKKRGAVTVRDVAEQANLAVSTVAEILRTTSSNRRYSAGARKRVMVAAEALNYVPNSAARSLVGRSTRTVGLLLQSPRPSDPARLLGVGLRYSVTLDAINNALDAANYHLTLGSAAVPKSPVRRGQYSQFMREQHADGIIVLFSPSSQLREELHRLKVPYVVIEGHEDEQACCVSEDEVAVGYLATKHLLDLGHKHIAFLNGERPHIWRHHPRQRGHLQALTEARVAPLPGWNEYLPTHAQLDKLLEAQPPTSMLVYDESDALKSIKYLKQRGLRVPNDVSIVALLDQHIEVLSGDVWEPRLTMSQTDLGGLGSVAVEKLLQIIRNPGETPPPVRLKPTLRIGESTATPRK